MKKIKKLFLTTLILFLIAGVIMWVTSSIVKSKTTNVIYTQINNVPKTKVAIIFGAGINGDKPLELKIAV